MRTRAGSGLVVRLCLLLMSPAIAFAQGSGPGPGIAITVSSAPVFLYADARRIPLRTLPPGTSLQILEVQGEWLQVAFEDPIFGRRVGFIHKTHVKPAAGAGELPSVVAPPPTVIPGAQGDAWRPAGAPTQRMAPPAATSPSPAPTRPGPRHRLAIGISGLYQPAPPSITDTFTFTQFAEPATVASRYAVKRAISFDIDGRYLVWGNLTVGVAVSRVRRSGGAQVDGSIPHPFFFDQDRQVTGALPTIEREEFAVHSQIGWLEPVGRKLVVGLGIGPSWLRVRQPMIQSIAWSDSYPYDSATFSSATTQAVSKSAVGFNVGGDIMFFPTRLVGVGGSVRYSRSSMTLPSPSHAFALHAGGLQVGAGMRIRILER